MRHDDLTALVGAAVGAVARAKSDQPGDGGAGAVAGAVTSAAPAGDDATRWRPARFTRAAGLVWRSADARSVTMHLPWVGGLSDGSGAIDARAIMAMLDHAASAAVYRVVAPAIPIATLDLRVAFAGAAPPGCALDFTARTTLAEGGVARVEAAARVAADGAEVASAAASFFVGASPGGDAERGDGGGTVPDMAAQGAAQFASFDAFLGMQRVGEGACLPFVPRLIGAEALPALHGGAVAALLATAACGLVDAATARLAAINVQYLRAGRAEASAAIATWTKRGARANFVSAIATQAQGTREVARAQCVFVTHG